MSFALVLSGKRCTILRTGTEMYLIVYRCYDNQEDESCFLVDDADAALAYLDTRPSPPAGFEHREGYYYFEDHGEIPYISKKD